MELRTMRVTSDITGKKKGSSSNDIFEKCRNFTRPSDLQAAGLYMYFEVFGDREGCAPGEIRMGKRKVLMFGSNDYLDLITHPKVKEAAAQAIRKYGSGCSGSRLLNGTLDLHVKLEAELAAFVRKEAAIIFGTGFQANYATLSALTEKGDVMICDHNLHASLVEGALRSPARTMRFRHNDMDHFERCLENCPPEDKILVVSEGVFSMEGDIADLRGVLKLAKPYGARVYVDEAHGIGVLGPTGAGAAEHLGVLDEIDIVMGTFSKSLASVGGFIAGEQAVIDYLKHTARPFVFSASLPAASVAAVGAALQIMQKEPERRARLLRVAQLLRDELRARGFRVLPGETAIVPVVIQHELDLCRLCKALLEEGIYINPVLRPAAAQNLLRISCTAAHTEAQVDRLVTTLVRVARDLEIPN
ncbi:MAG TPA: aminotransferase class I/II-fold pyridoxal phosphate-dependent enzyme [Bryobacteraceae bacterium]|jgi:8-amino-7-oxononanoate synthase|nr:aminotransferase class I/II-fold pyridoxal phosphate-dependent enzyme [Bryobacteraceae bacterium]